MKTKTDLYRLIMGSFLILILSLTACQDNSSTTVDNGLPQNTLQFFAHAESDRISREAPLAFDLFVGSSPADIDALAGFPVILLTEEGREARFPEEIWGISDVLPFGLPEFIYDPTRHIVISVYGSCEWSPFAGSIVCSREVDRRMFEPDWLTEIDYLCERCVQVFIAQINLQDAAAQANAHQIGASATIQPMPVGELMGEFVAGHWAIIEETRQNTTQILEWTEEEKYATLRWQDCNWLFEIRAKGQDGGFVFEDLIPIAQDVHSQVGCLE